jgi:hypothetical protein
MKAILRFLPKIESEITLFNFEALTFLIKLLELPVATKSYWYGKDLISL